MIRGSKRQLHINPEITKINVPIQASIHNRFDIEVVDVTTGQIKNCAQAENIICNGLWTRLLTPAVYWNNVHYGTGTGTPDVTDTSLFTFYASLAHIEGETIFDSSRMMDEGILSYKRKYQINENAAVGQTITEVGIAYGTASNNLCTHAMLKDMNGNQISIAKTDTDLINIYATIFVRFQITGYDTGHIKFMINPYNTAGFFRWLIRGDPLYKNPTNQNEYRYGLLPIGHVNARQNPNVSKIMSSIYNTSLRTLTLVGARIHINDQNNPGGSQCVRITEEGNNAAYRNDGVRQVLTLFVGGEWYPGTIIEQEAVGTGDGVKKDFATSFNYASEAVIYIDGQVAAGVSVESVPHKVTNALLGFNGLSCGAELGANIYATPYVNSFYTDEFSALYMNTSLRQTIFENLLYTYGIDSFTKSISRVISIECSDDMITWYMVDDGIVNSQKVINIPIEHKFRKYWRLTGLNTDTESNSRITAATFANPPPTTNIHFDVAPPVGAVITADYFTTTIAKDVNHVFDLTVTIQLGEYTET